MSFQRADACGLDRPALSSELPLESPAAPDAWRPGWDYARKGYGPGIEPWERAPSWLTTAPSTTPTRRWARNGKGGE